MHLEMTLIEHQLAERAAVRAIAAEFPRHSVVIAKAFHPLWGIVVGHSDEILEINVQGEDGEAHGVDVRKIDRVRDRRLWPEWVRRAHAELTDHLHHAPRCPANHYDGQRAPTGPCTCGAVELAAEIPFDPIYLGC